ncbi:EamA family transporter [Pseudarthrobacter sp. fls2-241-R2A-168]|uniref:EamA family transporter n=1 Tax=Pseudarthrobacter sp. fls2-241-R2A-168 TaxID=3040304 RepID=UPI002554CB0B|nr:EamA family transporter [Pseudarthrobacter sp. fls2-241-R2A-168]
MSSRLNYSDSRGWSTSIPAPVLMITAVLSVQFGAALAQTQFEVVGATGATFLRLIFAAIILLVTARPKVRGWKLEQWAAATVLGVALAGTNTLFYLAIGEIPIGVAVTLEFTGPLVLALVQTRRLTDAAWALLAFAGVVLLGYDGGSVLSLAGTLFALGAGAFWAVYILASARVGQMVPGVQGLAVSMAIGAVIALPFGAMAATSGAVVSPPVLTVFVGVALLAGVLPYALEMLALRRLSTRVFGVLSALGPAVAALAGLLVLGQVLGLREIIALVLVTAASVGVTVGIRQPRVDNSASFPRREQMD